MLLVKLGRSMAQNQGSSEVHYGACRCRRLALAIRLNTLFNFNSTTLAISDYRSAFDGNRD